MEPAPAPEGLTAALADRYRIGAELGAGGMATVYLAEDLKHQRKVAVKVLRPELAASVGPARFLREIRTAAQLQHPHILPLFDSGEAAGFLYYVMPHVAGESLRQQLAARGPLPIPDVIHILTEIVDALGYAHGRGVVHRDMKPDNILVSGRHPMVMDFGIAKALSAATEHTQLTSAGLALGSPAYMAPEQAAADPQMDHRVDIYALGVIGYELLTGQPPFTGMSASQVLAAHITQVPAPVSQLRPSAPSALAALIMRCLEKEPGERPQSAGEMLHVLGALVTPSGEIAATEALVPAARAPGTRRALWTGTAAAALVVAALVVLVRRDRIAAPPAPVRHTQLTFSGKAFAPQISPDGQFVAFVEEGKPRHLVVKDLAGGTVIPLAAVGAEIVESISWLPDGASLLFTGVDSAQRPWAAIYPRAGGAGRPVPQAAGQLAAVSPDGSRLAVWINEAGSAITLADTSGTRIDQVPVPKRLGWHLYVSWSPDGRWLALVSAATVGATFSISIASASGGEWSTVVTDNSVLSSAVWSARSDAIYFVRSGDELRRLKLDRAGNARDSAVTIQSGFGPTGALGGNDAMATLSITHDERSLVYARLTSEQNLWLAAAPTAAAPFVTSAITRGTGHKSDGVLSPDGKSIGYVVLERGKGDIFITGVSGGPPRRLTFNGMADSAAPAWSSDGRLLAFTSSAGGTSKLWTVDLEGHATALTGDRRPNGAGDLAWAPAARLLYQTEGNANFHWLDVATGAEARLVQNDSVGWMFEPVISGDGRDVAVFWNRGPMWRGTYVISGRDGAQTPVGPREGMPLGWSEDGRYVYTYLDSTREVRRVPATGGMGKVVNKVPFDGARCQSREHRGALTLLCTVGEAHSSDIWMMENFDPDAAARAGEPTKH
jgi:Tol biopolymer transport system component/tRNA A-37 threonylcarbamoyl transferase component Bud32